MRDPMNLRVMRLTHPTSEFSPLPYMQQALNEIFHLAEASCNNLASSQNQPPPTDESLSVRRHPTDPREPPRPPAAAPSSPPPPQPQLSSLSGALSSVRDPLYCPPVDTHAVFESIHALELPSSQGNVYVGEIFHAYVNLSNLGSSALLQVSLQIELQLSAQSSYLLFDNAKEALTSLESNQSFDCCIQHRLGEVGTYSLICLVSYNNNLSSQPAQRVMRRVFKFSVCAPFKISHKISHIKSLANKSFAQVTLENTSAESIFLNEATVQCQEGIACTHLDEPEHSLSSQGYRHPLHIRASDVFSLLFAFSASPTADDIFLDNPSFTKKLASPGNLTLKWSTLKGGKGCVVDYRLESSKRATRSVEMLVISSPPYVQVESPFKVEVVIINRLDRAVDPLLVFDRDKMHPLFTQGIATQSIGTIQARQSKHFFLPLIAIMPGLHSLQGITLYDPFSQQAHDCSNICEILVL